MKKYFAAIASTLAFISVSTVVQAAPTTDPVTVAAAKQMLAAINIRESITESLRQSEQVISPQIRVSAMQILGAHASMTPAQKNKALENFDEQLPQTTAQLHALFFDPALVDDMLAEMTTHYAAIYTIDEIRQLSAFYQSPVGQKMLTNMPKIIAMSRESADRVVMPRIQKIVNQAVADAIAK